MSKKFWSGSLWDDESIVTRDGRSGVIDPVTGEERIPFEFVDIRFRPRLTEVGVPVYIAVDNDDKFTAFDKDGEPYFGPVAYGEVPPGAPYTVTTDKLALHLGKTEDERAENWVIDLCFLAAWFHQERRRKSFGAFDIDGPDLGSLKGRIERNDEDGLRAIGLWGKRVELVMDVQGFGSILPKGTIGRVGFGEYAYAMKGMCSYDVELPVTDLEPHGREKTLGIGYEKLRLAQAEKRNPGEGAP